MILAVAGRLMEVLIDGAKRRDEIERFGPYVRIPADLPLRPWTWVHESVLFGLAAWRSEKNVAELGTTEDEMRVALSRAFSDTEEAAEALSPMSPEREPTFMSMENAVRELDDFTSGVSEETSRTVNHMRAEILRYREADRQGRHHSGHRLPVPFEGDLSY